jgi:uncharacterized protein (DUF1330 family)
MPAYVVVEVEVHDPDAYAEYRPLSGASVEQYGGRFIVRGGTVETVEGGWQPQRFVIIEFPSMEAARTWYDSPEYAKALPIRHRHATSKMLFVEGLPA